MDVEMCDKLPIDLDAHANNYRGQIKVQRMLHISRSTANHSLRSDALRLAYTEVKTHSYNTLLFGKVCSLATELSVSGCDNDAEWTSKATAESDSLRKRLESDLAAATANNIRESIRQSCMDLGTFFFDRSDFPAASKMFMRTRDLCSNNNQMLDFYIAVIRTYVMTQNWAMVSTFVGKAETMLNDPQTDRMKQIRAQMHAVAGLADLCMNRHKQSAANFSKVGAELGSSFDDIIASTDVARYGTLAALATHDRTALRPHFLNSPTFAVHLESMLEAREILEAMCTSRFAEAFRILEDLRPALLMDPFLTHQLSKLQRDVRCRVLQQYTRPFHSVRLSDMAEALGTSVEALEAELAELIVDGTIRARIDSHNKVLFRKMADERSTSIAAIVKAADDYISTAHTILLRSQLAKCDLRPYGAAAHLDSVLGIANEAEVETDGLLDGLDGISAIVQGGGFGIGESYSGTLVDRAYL